MSPPGDLPVESKLLRSASKSSNTTNSDSQECIGRETPVLSGLHQPGNINIRTPTEIAADSYNESPNSIFPQPLPSMASPVTLPSGLVCKPKQALGGECEVQSFSSHLVEERPSTGSCIIPSETTALLSGSSVVGSKRTQNPTSATDLEPAILTGKLPTTWQLEVKVLAKYSQPLIVTYFLQYSLTLAGVLAVGHLGRLELGAVSLASMTANITGYNIYQGLATSLDTLCAQAYGSGQKHLVGLQLQRMVLFLWIVTVPIGVVWINATSILKRIVPEPELADLAGSYLKVLLFGAPGYAAFECGKRYVQAQGHFTASVYVLIICAPLNALMCWLFVWKLQWGFVGAAVAIAITNNLLPLCLLLYVVFINGRECWPGLTRRTFINWGPMISLALPGLVMIEAEFLAFEILTLAASYFGTTPLAAQTVIIAALTLPFLISFPTSVAATTRIATFIGASYSDASLTAIRVAIVAGGCIGITNAILIFAFRFQIPRLFTSDVEVIHLASQVLPICAASQVFDALAAICNGVLRGLGRQGVAGWINLFSYYAIALPISIGLGFGLKLGLYGLCIGPAIGLCFVTGIESLVIYWANIDHAIEEARKRNSLS